jgi:hypothetical protein
VDFFDPDLRVYAVDGVDLQPVYGVDLGGDAIVVRQV